MARPNLWLLADGGYSYRIDFQFVSPTGNHLQSQTWEFFQAPHEPPQVLLLQADGRLVGGKPSLQELGSNYIAITLVMAALEGRLSRSVFSSGQRRALAQQLAAFPLTLAIVKGQEGLKFLLFTATPKT
jgi:hypothetical protein